MKKRKGVYVEMSEAELKAYREAKGDRTHRQILLGGVGLPSVDKQKGRPSKSDAELDLEAFYKKFRADQEKRIRDGLAKSTLDAEASIRMLGDESPWTPMKCHGCGKEFETLEKQKAKCPACSVMVKVPYKPVTLGLPSEVSEEGASGENVAVNREGNLSEGYEPATWPGKLKTAGVASNPKPSVIGWDESRFKFGKKKKKAK